jgi:hypothetical protein
MKPELSAIRKSIWRFIADALIEPGLVIVSRLVVSNPCAKGRAAWVVGSASSIRGDGSGLLAVPRCKGVRSASVFSSDTAWKDARVRYR